MISLGAVGLWLGYCFSACAPLVPVGDQQQPAPGLEFSYALERSGDELSILSADESLVFAISSPAGIGSATVSWMGGQLPDGSRVQLRLQGLESFYLRYRDRVLHLGVSSQEGVVVERTLQEGTGPVVTPEPDGPFWMEVRHSESGETGYFEVSLPPDLFASETTQIEISWIDFYRQ